MKHKRQKSELRFISPNISRYKGPVIRLVVDASSKLDRRLRQVINYHTLSGKFDYFIHYSLTSESLRMYGISKEELYGYFKHKANLISMLDNEVRPCKLCGR